jgi:hypothetical protein
MIPLTSTTASDAIKNAGDLMQQTITTFASLIEQSTSLSLEWLNSLTSNTQGFDFSSIKIPTMMPTTSSCGCKSCGSKSTSGCGCKIPPPCWMPQSAGCVVSRVCAGTSAALSIRVENCGPDERTITFDDAGKNLVTFQPASLTLGPMETGTVTATLASSSSSGEGGEHSVLVWIHGCKEYYIRWTVQTAKRASSVCSHEICIEDCPDFIHHWYDHFYCARPCPPQERAG